jgi:H+/Cl- antiporter ClcA
METSINNYSVLTQQGIHAALVLLEVMALCTILLLFHWTPDDPIIRPDGKVPTRWQYVGIVIYIVVGAIGIAPAMLFAMLVQRVAHKARGRYVSPSQP